MRTTIKAKGRLGEERENITVTSSHPGRKEEHQLFHSPTSKGHDKLKGGTYTARKTETWTNGFNQGEVG